MTDGRAAVTEACLKVNPQTCVDKGALAPCLVAADAYGTHLHCEAPEHRLAVPTRKLMTV